MKLLHIISSLQRGGAESLLVSVIEQLAKNSIEQSVIFFHDGPHRVSLEKLGIAHYQIKGLLCNYDPLFCYRLVRYIQNIKPDIIHTWLWAANTLGTLCGKIMNIPVVCSFHNTITQDGHLRNIITSLTMNYAKTGIAVSYGVAQSLQKLPFKKKSLPVHIIHNGIALPNLQEKKVSKNVFVLNSDVFIFGSVGRWVPLKNYPMLIEAFAKIHKELPNTHLVVLGNGPEENRLRFLVKEYTLEHAVTFIINQPAYKYYHLFDCFVLPSPLEGISMALLEAMSFNLPCIVTSLDGCHEVIKHNNNGILAENTVDALYQAMQNIYAKKDLRDQLGKQAFTTMEKSFSLQAMVEAYKEIYYNQLN